VVPVKKYLTQLYAVDGAAESFDSIALHPYANDDKLAAQALDIAHKVVKKAHDTSVGMWITEIGWASGGPKDEPFNKGKAGQAKTLKDAYKGFAKTSNKYRLRGVFWYSWRDKPGGDTICTWCGHAGLRAKNGTAKPAWDVFVKAAKG
jgi:exo-beta-1,3-glucanase (GH17 family)